MYRAVAQTVEGLIQQIAVQYVAHGYVFYVTGKIPDNKNTDDVDRKFLSKYGVDVTRSKRSRQRARGRATCHYIRYDRTFVLLAVKGRGRFFELASTGGESMRDASGKEVGIGNLMRSPLKLFGYSVSHRNGHASVRIEREAYNCEKAFLTDCAGRGSLKSLLWHLRQVPFERYAPVRSQLLCLLRAVNKRRRDLGKGIIDLSELWRIDGVGRRREWLKRSLYRPFEPLPAAI